MPTPQIASGTNAHTIKNHILSYGVQIEMVWSCPILAGIRTVQQKSFLSMLMAQQEKEVGNQE